LCTAAHHAELGVEAALVELERLPTGDMHRTVVLRNEAESSLAAFEAEQCRAAAWIDEAREKLTSRVPKRTSEHVGATGAAAFAADQFTDRS
jgi:hypothetical protein